MPKDSTAASPAKGPDHFEAKQPHKTPADLYLEDTNKELAARTAQIEELEFKRRTAIDNQAEDVPPDAESVATVGQIEHASVLRQIVDNLKKVSFNKLAKMKQGEQLTQKHLVVYSVREILRVATALNCGLCRHYDFLYTYNGEYWQLAERDAFERFLSDCAQKLGVEEVTAVYHKFSAELYKQFLATAYLPKPVRGAEPILINLRNGTFEFNRKGVRIRAFDRADFLTYQLPFNFDPNAKAPRFEQFLKEVLPDKKLQNVLAEYIGYIFARHLKLEKALILHGTGANGKSVFFDIMMALLGKENVSNYSLESLSEPYYRAMIADKLLNYASEISTRLQSEKFKQLTSGEPVEARLPYGQPMILTDYARLAFNCNELPRDVEFSEAFFRRFLILNFDITIPQDKRDPQLAGQIIKTELSGVFNWVLEGLRRLIENSNFSKSEALDRALAEYRINADSVARFLRDEQYSPGTDKADWTLLRSVYADYRNYCAENLDKPVGKNQFSKRLAFHGIFTQRAGSGMVVLATKPSSGM